MKLRYLLIVGYFCFPGSSLLFAQNLSVIDSLKIELNAADDKNRFNILNAIGFEYRYSYPDSTIYYCTQAYELGKQINLNKNLSRPLSFLGLAYTSRGDYKKSLEFHEQAIQIAAEQNDSVQLGHSYNNLGRMFFDAGDWVRAFNNFLSSKSIFESIGDRSGMAYAYRSLATIFMAQTDFEKAIEMSDKAFQIRKQIGDKRGIISSLIEFGLLFKSNGDVQRALEKYKQAEELARNIQDRVAMAEIAVAMAEIEVEANQFDQALKNVSKVMEVVSETSNQKLFIRALIIKSRILIHDEDFLQASQLLDRILGVSRNSGNLAQELEALRLGAICYDRLGRAERAQHYRNDFALLNEKIKNTDLLRQIDRLQFQLLVEKIEGENEILRAAKVNNESVISRQRFQNVILLVTVISFLIISTILFVYSRKRSIINLKLSQQNEKISNQQKSITETNEMLIARNRELNELNNEKDSLMNIVAHDLKAPLNRITGLTTLLEMEGGLTSQQREYLTLIKSATKAGSDLITDLLDVNFLNESAHKHVSVPVDVRALLERRIHYYQVSADLKSIKINFTSEIESDFNSVPDYLIRIADNLISNAIKFSPKDSQIDIKCFVRNASALISVRDSGPGFTDEDKQFLFQRFKKLSASPTGGESSNGLGLAIVKTLVDRLRGDIELKTSTGKGAEFIIRIPSAS
jgi:signal transduction histidine kinase/lipopolysaccharide biosynthesis regulator YciM